MALTNFSELKSNIADFLNRTDLTSVIPTFIAMAEAQFNRDIRHYKMENRATATVATQYVERPSDWLESIRMHLTGSGTTVVNFISAQAMADKRAGAEDATGTPQHYRHSELTFEFYQTQDGSYTSELLYYQKITSLSDSSTTNWLLTDHPDVYLYGSLLHSAPYLAEDDRVQLWSQLYAAAINRINLSSEGASNTGAGMVIKIHGLG